jgi:hypothetical protein
MTILGLYHVAERTRVTHMELSEVNRQIADQRSAIAVLETEWMHVANSDRVQQLAGARGMADAATAQLSSFDLLPHRGEDAPLNNSPMRNASAQLPAPPSIQPQGAVLPGF